MMKAVTTSLIVSLLLATVSTLPAQSETTTAVNEAVRRQADRITLRQKLSTADAAERRRELGTAATLYDECWTLIEGIGSGVEQEARQTVAGLTRVRMQLAKDAQARSDFREADRNVTDVLRVNSQDQVAQQFKTRNDTLLAQQKRFSPSPETLAQVPAIQKEKEEANGLVQDAKLLFELGKYDEADVKLQDAKKLDPGNVGANYYLSLVQQARFRRGSNNRDVAQTTRIVQVEEHWADESLKRGTLPVPNPYARTNLTYTSPARQAIMSKLDAIHLDSISYEGLPLSEVVRDLSEKAKKRDPEKKGINFLINPQQSAAASVATTPVVGLGGGGFGPGGGGGGFNPYGGGAAAQAPAAPAIDPTTGLPIPSSTQTADQTDIKSIAINISPALTDIRLADALEAIVTVADKPIKYSILDYAVVFSLKGPELAPLTSRRFKVDPNTFYQGLENVSGLDFTSLTTSSTGGGGGGGGGNVGGGGGGGGQNGQGGGGAIVPRVSVVGNIQTGGGGGGGGLGGGGGGGGGGGIKGVTTTNSMSAVQTAVIAFFRAEGVNLDPPKSVFFNDREGTLWVRATTEDLDIIEQAIQVLNIAPPQVNVRVKFVEVTQNDTKALGFDWYLGNVLMGGGRVAASAGTQPSMNGTPSAANPTGIFPGTAYVDSFTGTTVDTRAPASGADGVLTSGLRNMVNAPAVGSITGILTDPQFKMVLRALQQRNGVDELTDGNVTTLSGRQTQFQAVDLKYIVTSQNASQTSAGGGGNVASGGVSGGGNGAVASQIVPQTSVIPLGPTIDVIPYVGADGYTIQMSLIPTLIEFLGYDDPGQFIVQSQSVGGQGAGTPLTAILPLPHFRLRQVTTSCIVWDGQTIVLGGLISDNVIKVKDQLPILGDLPWVGRLFRSEQNQSTKGNLLIFVTPTIIDPAGNRVNKDEDLPFAQNTIPAQPKP